jgi:hypothetical protein
LFSYQYPYKRAHCCLKGDMRNALYNVGLNKYSEITEQAANDLASFFSVLLEVTLRTHRQTALS